MTAFVNPIKLIAITITFYLFANPTQAQNKLWNLQSCIDYAIANNIQVKQFELNTQMAKNNVLQSKMAFLPNLNGSASHVYNYGQTIDPYTNDFATSEVRSNNFYLSSGVTVFNGFQLLNNLKQKQNELLANKYLSDKMRDDIALSVATAYLQILYSYENLGNAKSQVDISRQQAEKTNKMVAAGMLAKGNQLNLESQVALDELQMVNAQNQLDMAYLNMTQLLMLDSVDGFAIENPEININMESNAILPAAEIYRTALQLQPGIKGYEFKLKAAEKGLNATRGALSPTISLRGSYGTGYSGASKEIISFTHNGYAPIGVTQSGETVLSPVMQYNYQIKSFNDQITDNLNKSIGLYLNIPIFNNFQVRNGINASKINVINAKYNLQNEKNQLFKAIQQAHADAQAALKRYMATEKSVKALEESYKYAAQKFELGLVTSIDYNDQKTKLAKAQSELLQAKYEYVFRIKVLDFYMGKPINL